MKRCQYCGASVQWVRMGRPIDHASAIGYIKLNANPASDGDVVIVDGLARVLLKQSAEHPKRTKEKANGETIRVPDEAYTKGKAGGVRYVCHAETCGVFDG